MSADWKRVEEILLASWELAPEARELFWASQVKGDTALLAELRSLSAARDAANRWTPEPSPEHSRSRLEPQPRRIGPYVIDRLIGRGGMGAVYLARRADGEFDQQVALKVIGLPFEIAAIREKFRRERQILAGLSHPNIAHLLDGGTTEDGELYLAMEYVDGLPIDRYAKDAGLSEKLRLFREVCAGVQYSHQHLVMHLDIKPSNILVNRDGVPKLLDFGAAKLLADVEASDVTRARMVTPGYASPEQLRGEPVSTGADVFALGALLAELILGKPAFRRDLVSGTSEAAFQVQGSLPGDLDRVVRKALAFERAERYSSVEQLSEDVRRFENSEPVLAHPPALSYRAGKFARRHRWSIGFAAAFLIAMSAMIAYSLHEANRARREAARALASNQFLITIFETPFQDMESHHDMTVRELLQLAEKRVTPVLGREPEIATEIELVLGQGFQRQMALDQARTLLQRALQRAKAVHDIPREAEAVSALASVAYESNHFDEAWSRAVESVALWEHARSLFSPDQAAQVLVTSGSLMQYLRPADPTNRKFLVAAESLARKYPEVPAGLRAGAFQALAESYLNAPGDADEHNRLAYPLIQDALHEARSDPSLGGRLVLSLQSWGRVNRFLGRFDVDESAQREAYQLLAKMLGPENSNTASQHAIWAYSLGGIGKLEDAYRESQDALAAMRRAYPERGSFTLWTNTAAAAYAACLTARFQECEALAREAMQAVGPNPQPGDLRIYEAKSYLGLALHGEGKIAESTPILVETVNFYRARNRRGKVIQLLESALADSKQMGRVTHP